MDYRNLNKIYPYIIGLNILVFLAMAISGVSLIEPSAQELLDWGASYKPNILEGQWWRLLSSMFVHIGIMHLLFNMYALLVVSVYLEPLLGPLRYLAAYLCSGIFGGLLSLWWHTNNLVVAGASGAIFGLYGVFFALLTTHLIPKEVRRDLLVSMGVFIAYNLAYGLQAGIDNASHIGGLLSGLAMGYIYYYTLVNNTLFTKSAAVMGIALATIAGVAYFLSSYGDSAAFYQTYAEFARLEEKAVAPYQHTAGKTAQQFKTEIIQTVRPNWEKSLQILKSTENLQLPDDLKALRANLIRYIELRLQEADVLIKAQDGLPGTYTNEIKEIGDRINQVLKELTGKPS